MYNEALARAVLADRARERATAMHRHSLHDDERPRTGWRRLRTSPPYLRGLPSFRWRTARVHPRPPDTNDDLVTLADT